jgi:hypothetical protein
MSIVPDRSSVSDEMSSIVCDDIVVALREEATDLLPTPTTQLDRQVSLWLDMAEGAFFECPPPKGFDAAYDDLDALKDSINALLEPSADGS